MNQGRTFKRFFVTRPDRITIALFAVALVALVGSLMLTPTPAYWEVLEGKRHHQIRVFPRSQAPRRLPDPGATRAGHRLADRRLDPPRRPRLDHPGCDRPGST